MEEIINYPQACEAQRQPIALAMHGNSHVISKLKPKVRIVHIFAPEIIKTDAANFRELVQRLTGKPTNRIRSKKKAIDESEEVTRCRSIEKVGSGRRSGGSGKGELKEEGELWVRDNSSGLFTGLGDFDGFIQEFGELPLLPLNSMDVFGEIHVS